MITTADLPAYTFAEYRKVGTTKLSNELLPTGTVVGTLEGPYTCAEPSRLAIDASGNVYPVAESVRLKSYEATTTQLIDQDPDTMFQPSPSPGSMREIKTHQVNGCNENLLIVTPSDLTVGGAPTTYQIINVSRQSTSDGGWVEAELRFQNGPIATVGTNGLTHEALTAVIIDRLEGFQRGPYACADNAEALEHYRAGLACLKRRTEARVARGVEGTHTV